MDLEGGQVYAGKLLHESFRDDPRAVERFSAEARLLASLAHENIVRVHELALIEGREVILMELVEGPSLQTVLAREGSLPEQRVIHIARGIARGLQAAHHLGLVHRDLKPANILLAPGEVAKLVDFGLARTTSLIGVDRTAFALVGTPDYMAPESIDPLAVDSRSDLYALGCLLFEMTAGRPPHDGASPFAVLEAHQRAPVPILPPTPERTPGFIALIGALLAKSPADRPQSAAAVVERLDALGQGDALAVAGDGAGARALRLHPLRRTAGGGGRGLLPLRAPHGRPRSRRLLPAGRGSGPGGREAGRQAPPGAGRLAALASPAGAGARAARQQGPPAALPPHVRHQRGDRAAAGRVAAGDRASWRRFARAGPWPIRPCAPRCGSSPVAWRRWLAGGVGGAIQLFKHLPGAGILATGIALVIGVFVSGWHIATRPVTLRLAPPRPVSPALARALETVAAAVPTIGAHRHRDSLRGVLARLLALENTLGARDRALAEEVAELALSATQATLRLDQLEDALLAVDLRSPGAADRARLHERDRLATRLLETAARLDSLRVRLALSDARQRAHAAGQALGELRFEVEALEEIAEVARR